MENATKALIIAAAVLISIVIVALGVLLISNVSDSSGEAQKVGDAIGDATHSAISGIQGDLNPREETPEDFNKFADDWNEYNVWNFIKVIEEKNNQLEEWERITIKGYFYYGDTDKKLRSIISDKVSSNLDVLYEFKNPTNSTEAYAELIDKANSFRDLNGYENYKDQDRVWRFGYDSNGYINVAEYIFGANFY